MELYNPMAFDLDLSGWSLAGGIDYRFPEGTVVAAGAWLVVAADPGELPGALGPFEGELADAGEVLELRSNGGRLIDRLRYGADAPWPVGADGSGASLARLRVGAASDRAEHWTASAELGGSPGAANGVDPEAPPTRATLVAADASWRYDASGDYPAADWADPAYDDGAWATGEASFYAGGSEGEVEVTLEISADNYYGAWLGQADGSDLRLVAEDPDGDWTTVESFALESGPGDHLWVAAWEAPTDYGGPQALIAELSLPDEVLGSSATSFEWQLGPPGACPGTAPADPPPDVEELQALVALDAAWAAPAVEADRSSDPWGWAISGSFEDGTHFVWADSFDETSTTNLENTYALFRSVSAVGAAGRTEIPDPPTLLSFRTDFSFAGDPARSSLRLACELDDGAIFYLNGVELLRENMPAGDVDADSLALGPAPEGEIYRELDGDALRVGENLLAVELHQAEAGDSDLRFACSLTVETATAPEAPPLLLNEVPAAGSPFVVELVAQADVALDGLRLGGAEQAQSLSGALAAGELLLVELEAPPEAGEALFLWEGEARLYDALRVGNTAQARTADGWRFTDDPSPGEANAVEVEEDVVLHEIQYHRAPISAEDEAWAERDEEWIELYNRGTDEVDLGGWQLVDAVGYRFPAGTTLGPGAYLVVANDAAALREQHPDIDILGDFSGRLGNDGDRVLLLDAAGNPADELRYFDDGRWPAAADGGGSSLELRDAWADNRAAESWAASDESSGADWVSYRYEGVAEASAVGPDGVWEELVIGLLDAGEVLLDDVSVIRDPGGAAVELVQNGGFADADPWRLLGNHRHAEVVADPDDPGNPVLRLVATGPTEHMHNHAETTLVEAIGARTYAISFRARWVSGSNQLHSRLYFNRLPKTTRLAMPAGSGTPGAPNSTAVSNLGPSFAGLRQDVAVPAPGEPVEISVEVADPDGVAAVSLWSAVDGGAFSAVAMAEGEAGRWSAAIEGQAAGSLVQFYVEAVDGLGEAASFPAAGPDSRALLRFDDAPTEGAGLHQLRLLMTEADADWQLDEVNLMSNDPIGATVVWEESEVFYDVGVSTKGSERGRPESLRLGYSLRFSGEAPLRGSQRSVLVDRSEGVGYGQRELLLNLVAARAGLVFAEYNDLVYVHTPRSEHTGAAELQLDRAGDLVLAAQFEDGDQGPLYDYELVYYPTSTDDGSVEGLKLPQPDEVVGTSLTDLGEDPEAWRWTFGLQNRRAEDDYGPMMELGRLFGSSDADLLAEAEAVIDVDQWLRAFAFGSLAGAIDHYGGDGAQHNARFYQRPEDGLFLYFPHDADFFGSDTMALVVNGDLATLLADPVYERLYSQHLQDLLERAYGTHWLGPWCDQLGELLPAQDFESHCAFVDSRAAYALEGASDSVLARHPEIEFAIGTNGGEDFTTDQPTLTLEGQGWIDVRRIERDGEALAVTWLDGQTWRVEVSLEEGDNELLLEAFDLGGQPAGSDRIGVSYTP